jgi:DNA adenine methylase
MSPNQSPIIDDSRAEVFRQNLRRHLRDRCLSQREAADEIGVQYKWLRRLCHHGLERVDRRSRENLEKLTAFLGIGCDSLWKVSNPPPEQPKRDWVLIKWTGSKRRQAPDILRHFPREIATYHEPFLGGGAVLQQLLCSDVEVQRIRCSDICRPLIDLWNLIKDDPRKLLRSYEEMWSKMRDGGKDYFYQVRDSFNLTGDPCEFFFLLRTCRNGLVRFNRRGEFTAAHHHGRSGIAPDKLGPVLVHWNEKLRNRDIQFTVGSFEEIRSRRRDFMYLDPPYHTAKAAMYYGRFDHRQFFHWLERQRARYVLSLNGFVGDKDCRVDVPEWHYDEHLQIDIGQSPYRSLGGDDESPLVTDSLYVRRER